jgi:hypothetical protein
VESAPLQDVDRWLDRFRGAWEQHLDALAPSSPEVGANGDGSRCTSVGGQRPGDRLPEEEQ